MTSGIANRTSGRKLIDTWEVKTDATEAVINGL